MFRLRHEEKKRTLCRSMTPGLTLAGRVLLAGCVVLVGFAWGLGLVGCAGRANGDASRDASSGSASAAASTPASTGDGTSAQGARADSYIDLHLHLDGAITPEIAKRLAEAQGIQLPASSDAELESLLTVPADCQSLNDFLKCFDLPLSLMQTPEGLSEAVRLVADNVRSQGVVYAEMRFAPQSHTKKGMTQEEAILAALDGLKKTDLKANLILCCMRGEGNEAQNDETLALAEKYLVEDGGVVAIDLAGAEALYPTANYRDLFARAKAAGVPFTIHAGEADGPQSVRHAIEFGATRIGHGVRSHEDQGTVELVCEKGVTLEMCPTSNRQTHAVEDMSRYPLVDFLNQGVKVTLNTDDMGIEGTTLADEFRYMERDFGLTAEQERTLLRNSVDAAFTSQEVKDQLRERLGL
ncbi:MAG: adenosine deaminase [Olsenella sp.]|nr:adenosine deaminase [Olsenella sp.]